MADQQSVSESDLIRPARSQLQSGWFGVASLEVFCFEKVPRDGSYCRAATAGAIRLTTLAADWPTNSRTHSTTYAACSSVSSG
jgi:hypothetical protein